MELDIRYVTRFVYPSPVFESQNALRACPVDEPEQRLIRYTVTTDPPARIETHIDRWGNRVDAFGILTAHDELVVSVDALVETDGRSTPPPTSLTLVDESAYINETALFRRPTRHTESTRSLQHAALELRSRHDDTVELVGAVSATVHDHLEYVPGSTEVGVDVETVWRSRNGVCQDFAHAMIALLRAAGVAARYVSGYFYAADPSDVDHADEGEIDVATHAWVEAMIPRWGWWGIDPTNGYPAGDRHVVVGRGRDYDDVAPLRGVYYGESDHTLAATVRMSTQGVSAVPVPEVDQ